ncbi:hypothetical protein D9M68_971560 [compost metagenome]
MGGKQAREHDVRPPADDVGNGWSRPVKPDAGHFSATAELEQRRREMWRRAVTRRSVDQAAGIFLELGHQVLNAVRGDARVYHHQRRR